MSRFILYNVVLDYNLDLIWIIWKIPHWWISEHMHSLLWIFPLQIACLYKTCNLVDVDSAAENLFCTTVSLVSELISHYPGLLIGGSNFTCLVQYPIFLPIDQRLSHGVAYLYRLRIHFLFSWPWHFLSIFPPSSHEPFQWKNLPLLFQTHLFLVHIYTVFLEVRMGLCYQQYWCIDENLNLSYTHLHWRNFKQIILWIPIKFIW